MSQFTADEMQLIDVWEAHTAAEFEKKDADAAMATMTDNPELIHFPVGTGALGRAGVRKFYSETLIPQAPPDFDLQVLTRSVGHNRVIDEFVMHFTHSLRMDWLAPGLEATDRQVAVPTVAIIGFEDGKICSEHIYWDQATVLVQLGLLQDGLPTLSASQCERLLDRNVPVTHLLKRRAP